MIVGQFINRYLSVPSGSTLRCSYLSKYLSEFCDVEVFSKDSSKFLNNKIDFFPVGRTFLPSKWPYYYCNNDSRPSVKVFNKIIRSFNSYSNIHRGNYDILHCHGITAATLANIYSDKITAPVIYDVHGLIDKINIQKYNSQFSIHNTFSAITVVGKAMKEFLINEYHFDPSKIHIIPDGIDLQALEKRFSLEECSQIKTNFGLENKKVLSYIGNFANLHLSHMLEIFNRINSNIENSDRDISFLIITQNLTDSQKSEISNFKGKNLIVGDAVPYEELFLYMRMADILLLPIFDVESSSTTPFFDKIIPSKLYTYLASGIPVVATDLAGHRELITNNVNGILASPSSKGSFVQASVKLLKDRNLRKRIGKNAKKTITEKHSWEVASRKAIEVYNEVLS